MKSRPLNERVIYIPRMCYGSAQAAAATFKSINIQAEVLPECTNNALRLASMYTSGEECLPQRVTLGGFLEIIEKPGFDPSCTALLMPTAHGPCRFGQYSVFIEKVLRDIGYEDVMVFSPTCQDGYEGFGINGYGLVRSFWRAIVVSDILRKLLLKTRPYEAQKNITDRIYLECLKNVCDVLSTPGLGHRKQSELLKSVLMDVREAFRSIPQVQDKMRPLIGAVGEIYCRLDDGSNDYIVRIFEELGGEIWLSGIGEWVEYTNYEIIQNLRQSGRGFSTARIATQLKTFMQRHDEHALVKLFQEDFRGYEEPRSIVDVLRRSKEYIPDYATQGEMVINTGRAVYLYEKGVDGIIDISPFSCMNGIVCEAVYPKVSRDHENIPIKVFYFDGKATDRQQDVEMFLELAREYKARKLIKSI